MTDRIDVQFRSQDQLCAAWLYLPDSASPPPVIVMAHGLGSVRTMRLAAYAERFAAAGYACLVFDYRHFGDSEGFPRQLLDVKKQLEDWSAAIAFARADERVDGSRIILWGTSFGGGHVLASAAAERRVSAVIAQCPFTDGFSSTMAINPWTSARLTGLAIADQLWSVLGGQPIYVPTAGKHGSVALMTAPDAEDGYLALTSTEDPGGFDNKVAARIALNVIRYFPGRAAQRIQAPVLFSVCDSDSVVPAGRTLKYARKMPNAEIKLYAAGHFDIYVGEPFERVVTDQLDFLQRHVPTTTGGSR